MRVLVTGKNSYAGRKFIERMRAKNSDLQIDAISVRDDKWMKMDFSNYDAVYHVAAIVHLKEKAEMEQTYYKVNSELPFKIARKAKNEGVNSFIFLSSIAVYGMIGDMEKDIIISKDTIENPVTFNGKSKLAAEELLIPLKSESFSVSILRVPLIYGPGCPGNYTTLSKVAKLIPVFPLINNKRSIIFVDHLSDIVQHMIEKSLGGVFLVNNPENFSTLNLVNEIASVHQKTLFKSKYLGVFIKKAGRNINVFKKIFGNVYYKIDDTKIEGFNFYNISFEKSIEISEKK